MFWDFLHIVFIVALICFTIKFGEIWIFESAQFLLDFVFVLKICHNFKSYQNMLTLSSLIFYVIIYKFI
jgi:hypothetical protein